MNDTRDPGRFDERAALDELERFRQDIARERARRREISDEFDAFTRTFKTPAPAEDAIPAAPAGRAGSRLPNDATPVDAGRPEAEPRAAAVRIELPRPPQSAIPPPPVLPVDPHTIFPTEAEITAPPPPRRRRMALAMVAALILAILGAWALWPSGGSQPQESLDRSAPAATPPADAAVPPPSAAAPPALESGQAARVTELTTTRHVWVRIIADGERVLERELPAGSRIPIAAQKTIVIRTGDAGAVSLTLAGEDQGTLGGEGQVVTRTFTVPEG